MPTILLVEDSRTLLKRLAQLLSKAGYDVITSSSGRQAVEQLSIAAIDLVLTDLYMPPPDGFEVIDAIKRLPEPVPVIVMSSHGQACEIFRLSRPLGADAVLEKPFSDQQLLEAIRDALGAHARTAAVA